MINGDNTLDQFHDTRLVYGEGVEPAPNQEAEGQGGPSGHPSAESLPSHIPSDAASVLAAASDEYGSNLPPDESGHSAAPPHDHSEADSTKDEDATHLQTLMRGLLAKKQGDLARSKVSVTPVGNSGITHVKIKGDSDVFDSVGIKNMNTANGPKELHYLSVPANNFQGRVIGGGDRYYDAETKEQRDKLLGPTEHSQQSLVASTSPSPESTSHAFINGSYFNMGKADPTKPEHTPIGETATGEGKRTSLPVPRKYLNDYGTLSIGSSKVTSGPVLSKNGKEKFPEEKLENPKYKYDNKKIRPGALEHAEHPNPRSGISVPGKSANGRASSNNASKDDGKQDASRLAVGLSGEQRGAESTGFTMPEWSRAMTRLDQMNKNPGSSLNLDGGNSSALGVVDSQGNKLLDVRKDKDQGVSTLIAFSDKPDSPPDQPKLKPLSTRSKIESVFKGGS
jgi:hypothetical protein